MGLGEQNWLIYALIISLIFIVYISLKKLLQHKQSNFQEEYHKVLTSKEHKIKRKY